MITKFEIIVALLILIWLQLIEITFLIWRVADRKMKEAVKEIGMKAKTLAITETAKFLKESLIDE